MAVQVADEMLQFWINFVEAIVSSSIKEVEDRFRPYIDRLVVCLCMLCKFDASEVSSSHVFICLIWKLVHYYAHPIVAARRCWHIFCFWLSVCLSVLCMIKRKWLIAFTYTWCSVCSLLILVMLSFCIIKRVLLLSVTLDDIECLFKVKKRYPKGNLILNAYV